MAKLPEFPLPDKPFTLDEYAQVYVKFRQAIKAAENAAVMELTPPDKIFDLFDLWINDVRNQELAIREVQMMTRHEQAEDEDREPWRR